MKHGELAGNRPSKLDEIARIVFSADEWRSEVPALALYFSSGYSVAAR